MLLAPPFFLNSAVNTLLKKEFDIYIEQKESNTLSKGDYKNLSPILKIIINMLEYKRNEYKSSKKHTISSIGT